MARIASYPVTDFSGGVVRDKSPYQLQKNELLDARNVEITDRGRLITRRGSEQVGNTLSGTLENSFVATFNPGGSSPLRSMIVNNNASTGVLSQLILRRLNTAITPASTTVVVDSTIGGSPTSAMAASGTFTINGDIITYSSKNGDGVTLEGVTGITSNHAVGTPLHQWVAVSQSGTAVDGTIGVYYAMIGNTLIFGGRGGNLKQMASSGTVSDVSGEPAVILLTNYRDRIYGAGDGGSGTNGAPVRVSFSARGDGTSWTTASDYFDVFDQDNEGISAMKVFGDRLGLFKANSIFTYDEIELKQRIPGVGAYNQKVVQEVGGSVFTFSPKGIFKTNLFEAKQIGDPVREYWENFSPVHNSGTKRVVTNTWASVSGDSYLLFINDITNPKTGTDVVLEYNTKTNSWTVHEGGFTNLNFLNEALQYGFGDNDSLYGSALFGGGSGSKFFKFYSNRYLNLSGNFIGGDIYEDMISDTGSAIGAYIETGLHDLTHPELFKKFKRIRVLTEQGQWNVEYRVVDERGLVGAYKPLGTVHTQDESLNFPKEAQGWRIGLRFSAVNTNNRSIFNGYVIEDTEVVPRP